MYVSGFVIPVPHENKDAYRMMSEGWWQIAKDYGALEHVENWEVDVPVGERTDLRRAVDLRDGEKVVFSWVVWPDKETADASHEKMTADPRFDQLHGGPLFDSKRMIFGDFEPLARNRRS